MRELKFRAWVYDEEKEEDKMVNVIGIFLKGNSFIPHRVIIDEDEKVWLLPNSELMQFTGLKDSNRKEIYDGDIVSWLPDYVLKNSKALIGKVVWGCEGFYLEQITDEKWQIDDYPSYPAEFYCVYDESIERLFMWEELEIIGNIFQNPELLEEVENG